MEEVMKKLKNIKKTIKDKDFQIKPEVNIENYPIKKRV